MTTMMMVVIMMYKASIDYVLARSGHWLMAINLSDPYLTSAFTCFTLSMRITMMKKTSEIITITILIGICIITIITNESPLSGLSNEEVLPKQLLSTDQPSSMPKVSKQKSSPPSSPSPPSSSSSSLLHFCSHVIQHHPLHLRFWTKLLSTVGSIDFIIRNGNFFYHYRCKDIIQHHILHLRFWTKHF